MFHVIIAPKNAKLPEAKDQIRYLRSFRVMDAALKWAHVRNHAPLTEKLNNRYYVLDARTGTIVNQTGAITNG